jgi:hypothetical protein
MLILKPTLAEIVTVQPQLGALEYADTVNLLIDVAYVTFTVIGNLPEESQLIAFGLAVDHLFTLRCWQTEGYPGVPTELSSRNERVRFNLNNADIFAGSISGTMLKNMLNMNTNLGFWARKSNNCC